MTAPERDPGDSGDREAELAPNARFAVDRPIALVGLMGVGKTTIGRRVAAALKLPFVDADQEIEKAAGLSVSEIFARHGEAEFRRGERQVIMRLLSDPPHVLATGGGAFMDAQTRAALKERAVTVWLKAPIEVLLKRVEKRETRPLLKGGDPEAVLRRLQEERYPVYAEADLVVESTNAPHAASVQAVLAALEQRFKAAP